MFINNKDYMNTNIERLTSTGYLNIDENDTNVTEGENLNNLKVELMKRHIRFEVSDGKIKTR